MNGRSSVRQGETIAAYHDSFVRNVNIQGDGCVRFAAGAGRTIRRQATGLCKAATHREKHRAEILTDKYDLKPSGHP